VPPADETLAASVAAANSFLQGIGARQVGLGGGALTPQQLPPVPPSPHPRAVPPPLPPQKNTHAHAPPDPSIPPLPPCARTQAAGGKGYTGEGDQDGGSDSDGGWGPPPAAPPAPVLPQVGGVWGERGGGAC
jgi:hypothetical protein